MRKSIVYVVDGVCGCVRARMWAMSCKMRSVSFVDRLEYDFTGNHFAHALELGDVDGDGVSLGGLVFW